MRFGLLLTAGLLAMTAATADQKLQSGPQLGERPPALDVVDVTGPNKGKQLCYV
jgi:hypothetical protein